MPRAFKSLPSLRIPPQYAQQRGGSHNSPLKTRKGREDSLPRQARPWRERGQSPEQSSMALRHRPWSRWPGRHPASTQGSTILEHGFPRNRLKLGLARSWVEVSVTVTWYVRGSIRGRIVCSKSQGDQHLLSTGKEGSDFPAPPGANFEARYIFTHKLRRENVPSHVPIAY